MKKVQVKIDYKVKMDNGSEEDILTFSCPYKKYTSRLCRDDIDNFVLADLVDEQEANELQKNYAANPYGTPTYITIKMEDIEYKYLFQDSIDYTDDKKKVDITNMFTYLKWKISQAYNDIPLYKKYVDNVDLDGRIDGCTYCQYYSDRDYCSKFNMISPSKCCIFYRFRSIK